MGFGVGLVWVWCGLARHSEIEKAENILATCLNFFFPHNLLDLQLLFYCVSARARAVPQLQNVLLLQCYTRFPPTPPLTDSHVPYSVRARARAVPQLHQREYAERDASPSEAAPGSYTHLQHVHTRGCTTASRPSPQARWIWHQRAKALQQHPLRRR
jgi:hypothetical protein